MAGMQQLDRPLVKVYEYPHISQRRFDVVANQEFRLGFELGRGSGKASSPFGMNISYRSRAFARVYQWLVVIAFDPTNSAHVWG